VSGGRDAILVIKLGALGDMIQALPSFHDLRRHDRDARLVLLTTPPYAALAARMPWFDEVWSDGRPKASDWRRFLALVRRLRGARFRRVYDLQCNDRTALYFRLLAGRHRPEWVGAARGADIPLPPLPPGRRHNCDVMRAQLAAAGVPPALPTDLSWLAADVARFELPREFVLLAPGSSPHLLHKRWPARRYAALANRLRARGLAIVLIGTAADRDAATAIAAAVPGLIDLTGRTDLVELATIARRAAGVVGNDTGPVALAAMLGAPTLMLMSRHTDPERSGPRGPKTAWLKRDDLGALSVEEVEAAILLRRTEPA
jgi:ADP-heptose:LPS heptosyltransferase